MIHLEVAGDVAGPGFDRNRIYVNWQVREGDFAWAPYGKNRWSAIEITSISKRRVNGKATRVDPVSGDAKGKFGGANVKLSRLVRRDPEAQGRDKPPPPHVVFQEQPAAPPPPPPPEEPDRDIKPANEEELPKGDFEVGISESGERPGREPDQDQLDRVGKLFELFDDDSTTSDW